MTALILTPDQAKALLDAVRASYHAKKLQPYWLPSPVRITSGPHAGQLAVDVGPEALSMVMIEGQTLEQLPEYQAILAALGNPKAVELTAEEIRQPEPRSPQLRIK